MSVEAKLSAASDKLWAAADAVRAKAPLVQCLTNFVSMDFMANGLLAIGATPCMAHFQEELNDIVPKVGAMGGAVSINTGTLDAEWIKSFRMAVECCHTYKVPWVLDPVAAGFSQVRTETPLNLIAISPPTVIRGNGSEIMALAGAAAGGKGVDSTEQSDAALEAAQSLAKKWGCVVCVSGATDYVVAPGSPVMTCSHGHEMLTKVTAAGCLLSSVVAAFVCSRAEDTSVQEATALACTYYGLAAEVAMMSSSGPGTFRVNFIDCLYNLRRDLK